MPTPNIIYDETKCYHSRVHGRPLNCFLDCNARELCQVPFTIRKLRNEIGQLKMELATHGYVECEACEKMTKTSDIFPDGIGRRVCGDCMTDQENEK